MKTRATSKKTGLLAETLSPLIRFFDESNWASRFGEPGICDFTIGNPHDMPILEFVEALEKWITPQDRYWYAYKRNESPARTAVAESLRNSHKLAFEPEDVFLTNGATAALAVVLAAIIDPGDEVIFISPPWFQYETMIMNADGVPVRTRVDMKTLGLDLAAIEAAINEKTRGIIINSPHNPTGKIYLPEVLETVAGMLTAASERYGRAIYLISDEAYRKIIFDGRQYYSPAAFYKNSFVVYTYGKSLVAPGQRVGYIALPPDMVHRREFRDTIPVLQMVNGWAFPNALLQHSLADLDRISIDMAHLQAKRDRLVPALRNMGYETTMPEGTFYVIVRSPLPDDQAFIDLLSEYNIFCVPGSLMDLPGYFRICLTASDEMIERSLPGFELALARANEMRSAASVYG
jgi:aspartate aminotransferase